VAEEAMETFVIQIPTRAEGTAESTADELRGVVEHVGSGNRQPFADPRELLAFLRADHRGLSTHAQEVD
jgi:hypothetical protein